MGSSTVPFDPAAFREQIGTILNAHAGAFGVPQERHALLRRQIADGDALHARGTWPGHVTTSAFILDPAGRRILLIHHRSLGRWLQPGGHYEPPDEPAMSALREAVEETGMGGLVIDPWHARTGLPIDIDSHRIPARPERNEPEHWHHDIRYVVRATERDAVRPDLREVHGAAWRDVADLETIAPQALRNMRLLGLAHP
ncbi:NUDIX domain-containing protein [Microvirga terrae]|uniref:NUDIX domain-containing protein n=1 Tax=Microvirga terrae TaxID=2740529 RepID=A0ABY5RNH6_9HYPH|nr:NUDIX domain-containing protein [Microvirga terrae]UVF18780.1 NUDIX domain-containing protein [Microvirga terrae]